MKRFTFFLAMSLISVQLFAQVPDIEWQRSYGGKKADLAYSVDSTSDGGYIMAGFTKSDSDDVSGNHGGYDFWIVKLNHLGDIEWQKALGGSGDDSAYSIRQTADSGYIIAGGSFSSDGDVSGNHGGNDAWVVKLNNAGEIEWQKSYGGSGDDSAYSVQQTFDGGYIVAGYSNSNDGDVSGNHGDYDAWLIKLNNIGEIEWQKSYGGTAAEEANSIWQTFDGGYIIAGHSDSQDGSVPGNHGLRDVYVVKINSTGDVEWQKSFGGSSIDEASSIQQTYDGGYILACYTSSVNGDITFNHGQRDVWILKLRSSGDIVWQKTYGGSGIDSVFSIQETFDNGYVFAGTSDSQDGDVTGNHGLNDYWVVKLNNPGNIQWQRSLGGSMSEVARAVCQTPDGGFIVTGPGTSHDGDATHNYGGFDFWTVKLSPDDLNNFEINFDNSFSVYPNPVSDFLTIEGIKKDTNLIITSLNGQMVYKTTVKSGKTTMNVSHLPAGIYFINNKKFIKK